MASAPKKSAAAQAAAAAQVEPDLPTSSRALSEAVEAIVEPALEMQETVRNAIEKGVVGSRAAFVKAKASAEDAANAFELSFAAAKDGVVAFNTKAFAAARANAEANLDFVKASLAAKSVSDFVSSAERVRPQADRRGRRPVPGSRRTGEEDRRRDHRADQGSGDEDVQDRGLICSSFRGAFLPRAAILAPPALQAASFSARGGCRPTSVSQGARRGSERLSPGPEPPLAARGRRRRRRAGGRSLPAAIARASPAGG